MKARLKWMRVTGLWRDQRIWFTLCSKVLEAFVVLQERPQIIRAGERLPAVPQHRGGGGQPWHSLFMDRSKLEMWQNKAYFTKTFRPVYIITFFKYLKSEMKRAGTKSPRCGTVYVFLNVFQVAAAVMWHHFLPDWGLVLAGVSPVSREIPMQEAACLRRSWDHIRLDKPPEKKKVSSYWQDIVTKKKKKDSP